MRPEERCERKGTCRTTTVSTAAARRPRRDLFTCGGLARLRSCFTRTCSTTLPQLPQRRVLLLQGSRPSAAPELPSPTLLRSINSNTSRATTTTPHDTATHPPQNRPRVSLPANRLLWDRRSQFRALGNLPCSIRRPFAIGPRLCATSKHHRQRGSLVHIATCAAVSWNTEFSIGPRARPACTSRPPSLAPRGRPIHRLLRSRTSSLNNGRRIHSLRIITSISQGQTPTR